MNKQILDGRDFLEKKEDKDNNDPLFLYNMRYHYQNNDTQNTLIPSHEKKHKKGLMEIQKTIDYNDELYKSNIMSSIQGPEKKIKRKKECENQRVYDLGLVRGLNIDKESDMIQGIEARLFTDDKEYSNPAEHYYDYISKDINIMV